MSLIALTLFAALSGETPAVQRNCRDDNGIDRCDAGIRAETLRALGMASIEDQQASGDEVYRALMIDGYGRLMPAIAFERPVGAPPQVTVYAQDGRKLTAPARLEDWRAVQEGARFADRELAPGASRDPDEINICLHAWLSTVEMANVVERGAPTPGVRRRTESACGGGLTTTFAFDLAARAIAHFPACAALDPDEHRNDVARLAACAGFRGDGLAAAELMNQIGWRAVPDDHPDAPMSWARMMGINVDMTLDWAGQRVQGGRGGARNPVAVFLAGQVAATPGLRGYIGRFDAVSSTRVETTGHFEKEDADEQRLVAPFRQVWIWESNSLQRALESWTVEAFQARSQGGAQ